MYILIYTKILFSTFTFQDSVTYLFVKAVEIDFIINKMYNYFQSWIGVLNNLITDFIYFID